MRLLWAAVALLLSLAIGSPHDAVGAERVDLYHPDGSREGYALVDRETGRAEYFDARSRRTGYGVVNPGTGRTERFTTNSQRQARAARRAPPRERTR